MLRESFVQPAVVPADDPGNRPPNHFNDCSGRKWWVLNHPEILEGFKPVKREYVSLYPGAAVLHTETPDIRSIESTHW